MAKIYRVIVASTFALTLVFWALPYFESSWLSADELSLRQYDGFGALIAGSYWFYWSVLAAWVLCFAGLFFFIKLARIAFLVLICVSIVTAFLWGVRVQPPYEVAMLHVLSLLDGMILAMAYLTPVKKNFESPAGVNFDPS